jgi:serine/threonine protein phosphatase 1
MLSRLRRLMSRSVTAAPAEPPAPNEVMSVVGDVHGCARMLADLLTRLPGRIVLVGDLIDRGNETAATLDLAMSRPEVTVLRGNHEDMLLTFIDDPDGGQAWLRYGGLQTLASFGVGGDPHAADMTRLRDRLVQAMGAARIDWLRARPVMLRSGTVAVTHAGADPGRSLDDQGTAPVWGHRDCGRVARADGVWIVHGHVIVPEPDIRMGVIRVDTGAYAGGPLTAAVLGDGALRFESVR